MASKDELAALGFEVQHSSPYPGSNRWGTWFVGLRQGTGRIVNGYGTDEESAFADALKTATTVKVEPVSSNKH